MDTLPRIQKHKYSNSSYFSQIPKISTSKQNVFLPKIDFQHRTEFDINLKDENSLMDEIITEEDFRKKKKTIKTFFKQKDLKIFNINAQGQKKTMNLLSRNASLEFINLSKKMFENNLDAKKEKGSLMVNELWSNNYYKKVMKFSNLKNIMDNILKSRRSKFSENRKKILSVQALEFSTDLKQLDPLNPFKQKKEKSFISRRGGVSYGEIGSAKKKSLSLDEVSFNEKRNIPSNLKTITKKYICDILNKCENYNREIKALNKDISKYISPEKKIKIKDHSQDMRSSLTDTLNFYFERKKKKEEHH